MQRKDAHVVVLRGHRHVVGEPNSLEKDSDAMATRRDTTVRGAHKRKGMTGLWGGTGGVLT